MLVNSLSLPPNLLTIHTSRRGARTLMSYVAPVLHLGRVVIGLGMHLMRFLGASFRSRTALAAETLFLRKQLALHRERRAASRRALDGAW